MVLFISMLPQFNAVNDIEAKASGRGGQGQDLTLNITFWPSHVCASPGAIYPVGLEVTGPSNASYELSAWLYNGRQLANVWDPGGAKFRWADYQTIVLDGNGTWAGYRYLQVKAEPKVGSSHYLKAKVRNDTDQWELKNEDWQLFAASECATLIGYVGNGTSAWAGAPVMLLNETGAVVAANLSLTTPWQPHGLAGAYQLNVPAGNYTFELYAPIPSVAHTFDGAPYQTTAIEMTPGHNELDLGWQGPRPANASERQVVIYEFAPDTYLSDEPDEYLTLWNPTEFTLDLGGWSLYDGQNTAYLPDDANLPPDGKLFLSRNATAFELAWGQAPDLEFQMETNPASTMGGEALRLGNSGGNIQLRDHTDQLVDRVVYGLGYYEGEGWEEEALEPPDEGQVYVRWSQQDTNNSDDWHGNWQAFEIGQSRWPLSSFDFAGGRTFVSPDNSYDALTKLIDEASDTLKLNLYTFTSPWLAMRLANASARGVSVTAFIEGSPVGGLSNDSLWAAHTLAQAGAEVRFLVHGQETGTRARYLNDHAKYLLADDRHVAVMSENWNRRGISVDPSRGNRGWGIILDSPELYKQMDQVFEEDSDPARLDIDTWGQADLTLPPGVKANWSLESGNHKPAFESQKLGAGKVTLLLSPENVMAHGGLMDLLNGAKETLWVQQASLPLTWWGQESPYVRALIDAARRNVSVRVLVDGGLVYSRDDNQLAVDYLNGRAQEEGWDLEARLFPGYPMVKLHNKGAIVDGEFVLVGSTNWVRAAAMDNREVSLWVESHEAAEYYGQAFQYDWTLSAPKQPNGNNDSPGFQCSLMVWLGALAFLYRRIEKLPETIW